MHTIAGEDSLGFARRIIYGVTSLVEAIAIHIYLPAKREKHSYLVYSVRNWKPHKLATTHRGELLA